MVRQCSFPGCKNITGLHRFPSDPDIRRQWMLALCLPDRDLPPRAGVCNVHFSADSFSNLTEVKLGYRNILLLKHNAVPKPAVATARPTSQLRPLLPATSRHIEEASQLIHTTYITKAKVSLGTQTTDLVLTKSVGTQLSCTTLKNHVRSKATQTIPQEPPVEENISQFQLLYMPGRRSAASLHCRAAETPGLEEQTLLKENVKEQQDQSDESLKEVGEMSRVDYADAVLDYAVLKNLLSLFEKCPACHSDCQVQQQEASGSTLSLTQLCSVCSFSMSWCSQLPAGSSDSLNLLRAADRAESFALVEEEKQDNETDMDQLPGLYRCSDIQAARSEPSILEKPTPQHIVEEDAILQLIKHCPICRKLCRCSKYRRGPYMVIYQKCYFCHYQRKWANQPEARTLNKYKMVSKKRRHKVSKVTTEEPL